MLLPKQLQTAPLQPHHTAIPMGHNAHPPPNKPLRQLSDNSPDSPAFLCQNRSYGGAVLGNDTKKHS